jgi:MFS-type transporter involved in bile tolerance (Atg22 family)
MENNFDVIIIGSGAGGAPIAHRLAKAGKSVLILEKGPLFVPQYQSDNGLSDFKRDELFATGAEKAYIVFGLLIGLVFGPVQASSRAYMARSVSVDETGRYFGIYALAGRATSFLAPLSVALVTDWSGSARAGMAMILIFFVVGLAVLMATPYPAHNPDQNSRNPLQ